MLGTRCGPVGTRFLWFWRLDENFLWSYGPDFQFNWVPKIP